MKAWRSVYSTKLAHQAEIVKSVLQDNKIMAVVVNKNDSVYPMLGRFEVHVDPENLLRSLKIIEDDISFGQS